MNTIVRLSEADFVGNALIGFGMYKKRRCITLNEIEEFKTLVKEKLEEENIYFGYDNNGISVQDYCDYVLVNDSMAVYRLKPNIDMKDLIAKFSGVLPLSVLIILRDKELYKNLNDLTDSEEKGIEAFRVLDEKYHLEVLYSLISLERKRKLLQENLEKIENNLISKIDRESIGEVLELNPEVTEGEMEELLIRKKKR